MENPPRQTRREVRTEIQRPVLLDAPREIHARIFFRGREFDVRIGLVVAQHDVEFRAVLLDEVVLERQGFALIADENRLHVGDFPRQRTRLGIGPT